MTERQGCCALIAEQQAWRSCFRVEARHCWIMANAAETDGVWLENWGTHAYQILEALPRWMTRPGDLGETGSAEVANLLV